MNDAHAIPPYLQAMVGHYVNSKVVAYQPWWMRKFLGAPVVPWDGRIYCDSNRICPIYKCEPLVRAPLAKAAYYAVRQIVVGKWRWLLKFYLNDRFHLEEATKAIYLASQMFPDQTQQLRYIDHQAGLLAVELAKPKLVVYAHICLHFK